MHRWSNFYFCNFLSAANKQPWPKSHMHYQYYNSSNNCFNPPYAKRTFYICRCLIWNWILRYPILKLQFHLVFYYLEYGAAHYLGSYAAIDKALIWRPLYVQQSFALVYERFPYARVSTTFLVVCISVNNWLCSNAALKGPRTYDILRLKTARPRWNPRTTWP